jgi:ABC-type multidrug transport system fused ATPase/permease subunit
VVRDQCPSIEDLAVLPAADNVKPIGILKFPFQLPFLFRVRILLTAFVTFIASILDAAALALVVPLAALIVESNENGDTSGVAALPGRAFDAIGIDLTVAWTVTFILTLMVIRAAAILGQIWLLNFFKAQYEAYLRRSLFRKILDASWPFYYKQSSSNLVTGATLETQRAATSYGAFITVVASVLDVSVYMTIAILVSWQLSLGVIAGVVVLLSLLWLLIRVSRRIGQAVTGANRQIMFTVSETLNNAKVLKSGAMEDQEFDRFDAAATEIERTQISLGLNLGLVRAGAELGFVALLLGMMVVGTRTLDFSSGTLVLFALLFFRMFQRTQSLQSSLQGVNVTLPGLDAVNVIASSAVAHREPVGGEPFTFLERGVALDGVTFSYERDETILDNVSVDIPTGSAIGFVGGSGSGKTTILDMTAGLLVPERGAVRVDGADLRDLDLRSWRRKISYVTQESVMFHDTILNNLRWARPDATVGEIEEVCERAAAHDFIVNLPSGYQTVVGDRGVRLSGGQRQRLALARALIKRPLLLILDEATSELDVTTEQLVQRRILENRGTMTMVIAAHRVSTIMNVDEIYVFGDGKVLESGSPAALLDNNGPFKQFWSQSQAEQTGSGASEKEAADEPPGGH